MGPSRLLSYSLLVLAYALGCASLGFFGVFLWAGPHPIVNLKLAPPSALVLDALLSVCFFLQHSGMIRRSFRAKLGAVIPDHYCPVIYAIASGLALLVVPALWQPSGAGLLELQNPVRSFIRGVFLAAMAGMVWGFGSLKFFDPIGSGPLLAHLRGTLAPAAPLTIRGPYRWVRHPIYSFMLVMIWASPDVTADRLLFNILWTIWVVAATRFEEKDLTDEFGEPYKKYQRSVPMLVPSGFRPRW
ncbi:MAG: isoprenylcysteine carboxylmethyltransferase family protein [Terriglobia bacterium]